MAINFNSFSDKSSFSLTDKIVGFDSATPNGEKKWTYSTLLKSVSGDITIVKIQDTAPTSPKRGDLWFNSSSGVTYVYYIDANSSQWIDVGGGDSGENEQATTTSAGIAELATLAEVQTGVGTNTIVTPETLNTLLQTLSTNIMNNLGNYPYLEYAWVTAPNAAGQSINANQITTLTIDTEVADTGNFGSISSNQITLAAGTYEFEANTHGSALGISGGAGTLALYNISDSSYVSRGSSQSGASDNCDNPILKGRFTITAQKTFDLRYYNANLTTHIKNTTNNATSTISTANAEQRTTIKLWKVG